MSDFFKTLLECTMLANELESLPYYQKYIDIVYLYGSILGIYICTIILCVLYISVPVLSIYSFTDLECPSSP